MTNKDSIPKKRIKFDGRFTDEIRRALSTKRLELGLPYHTIAQYFTVNWSTFRKWESGATTHCELRHRPLIEAFLNGDLDEDLKYLFASNSMKYPQTTPVKVFQSMERIANTYTLCAQHPSIGDDLLNKIDKIAFDTLRYLVSAPRDDMRTPFPSKNKKIRKR